jgi:hypothetical protein
LAFSVLLRARLSLWGTAKKAETANDPADAVNKGRCRPDQVSVWDTGGGRDD